MLYVLPLKDSPFQDHLLLCLNLDFDETFDEYTNMGIKFPKGIILLAVVEPNVLEMEPCLFVYSKEKSLIVRGIVPQTGIVKDHQGGVLE